MRHSKTIRFLLTHRRFQIVLNWAVLDICYNICYITVSMRPVAERIKRYRVSMGLSQEQLARQIGVSWATVQRWESGKTLPSPLAMVRLDEILGDVLEREQPRLM